MIVRLHHHSGRPDHVYDRKRIRLKKSLDFCALWFSQSLRTAVGLDTPLASTSRTAFCVGHSVGECDYMRWYSDPELYSPHVELNPGGKVLMKEGRRWIAGLGVADRQSCR